MTTTTRSALDTRYALMCNRTLQEFDNTLLDEETRLLLHSRDYARTLYHRYQSHHQALATIAWARDLSAQLRANQPAALAAIAQLRQAAHRATAVADPVRLE